jgi:hypothetical protein
MTRIEVHRLKKELIRHKDFRLDITLRPTNTLPREDKTMTQTSPIFNRTIASLLLSSTRKTSSLSNQPTA